MSLMWLMLVVRQQYWRQPTTVVVRSIPLVQTNKRWWSTGSL